MAGINKRNLKPEIHDRRKRGAECFLATAPVRNVAESPRSSERRERNASRATPSYGTSFLHKTDRISVYSASRLPRVKLHVAKLKILAGALATLLRRYQHGNGHWRDNILSMFTSPGDLAFDIGANVGDCLSSLRRLGAVVVAVEPQPAVYQLLKILHGRDREILFENLAVGAKSGYGTIHLNLLNPTTSTISARFVDAAQRATGWEKQKWELTRSVAMTTLDDLIARYGVPVFCKIDVEGYEAEVLRGLNYALPAISFEFTTIQRPVALRAVEQCQRLGVYVYNAALGENEALVHPKWLGASALCHWIGNLPHSANSGDIYALRIDKYLKRYGI